MFNQNCGTTLVSQLLDSIDDHLKEVRSPMAEDVDRSPEHEMSVDQPDDDELWLSGHRSIFSSYGSHYRKTGAHMRDSQYEGFHWDLYEDRNYHHLAFEHDDSSENPAIAPATSLSEWSMRLSSGVIGAEGDTEDDADAEGDDTTSSSDLPRTSWHAIKSKSLDRSCSSSSANTPDGRPSKRSDSPLTLYRLFQRNRSQQHPCRLYQNFSDKSMCDSLTSSSCSNLNPINRSKREENQVPLPRFQLKSPTTFSQLRLDKSNSQHDLNSSTEQSFRKKIKDETNVSNQHAIPRQSVDQCLQTSIIIDKVPLSPPKPSRRFIPRSASRPVNNTVQFCTQTENLSVTRSKSADRITNNQATNLHENTASQSSSSSPSSTTINGKPLLSNILSLPDLSFLNYYAKENPAPRLLPESTENKQNRPPLSGMKCTISEPSSLTKKATRTVFYCSIKVPSTSSNLTTTSAAPLRPTNFNPSLSAIQRPRTLKEIKRIKSIKTSPTPKSNSPLRAIALSPSVPSNNHETSNVKEEETATLSSTCSSTSTSANSTSSSGYFSNSSTNHNRPVQTPNSSHPLKSCLKRAKTEDLTTPPFSNTNTATITTTKTKANVLAVGVAGDIFTLAARTLADRLVDDHGINMPRHRRYSAPVQSSHPQVFPIQLRTQRKGCTLSEHDLRAKKSVSFCDDIARRLITPSASPKHRPTPPPRSSAHIDRYYGDLVPRESLTDSPPSEFNLSEDENDDCQLPHPMNFTENAPSEVVKPLPVKYGSDKYLIDAFATTVLHIMEIKCSDPQSLYLNNANNRELDRTLRQDLCPLLREILEDGLRQYSSSLFSRKVNLWRLIDLTTPTTGRFHEAKTKAQLGLSSTIDWTEKFNAFIYQLLNIHELAAWLVHFVSNRVSISSYYEPWAFILVHGGNDLFESVTNQLEKLSPLPFRLKYVNLPNATTTNKTTNTNSNTLQSQSSQRPSSLLTKKFNVRAWLRDRKTQIKVSPKEPQAPSTNSSTSSAVGKSSSSSTNQQQKSVATGSSNKTQNTVVQTNTSARRKLGSIPVAKRHQTVH